MAASVRDLPANPAGRPTFDLSYDAIPWEIAVTLLQMLPGAVPDVTTGMLMVATIAAIVVWRLAPLPLMMAGGMVGAALRAR